jgi:glycosyltransferase involved in cell wall biosynthesis
MKILHITKGFYPDKGGVESYSYEIVKRLADKNKVFVISTHSKISKKEKIGKIKVIRLKKFFDFLHAPINPPYFHLIKKINPDIIHFHIPNPLHEIYLLIYLMFLGKKNKLIATYHADLPDYTLIHKILEFFRRFYLICFLRFFDEIIATSKEYVYGSPILRIFRKKVKIIPLGISRKLPTESIMKIKRKYKIGNEKIVLFVGRLFPYKGLRYLILAIPKVIEHFPNVKFFIIGSGEKEMKLKRMVKELKIEDKVIFTGSISNKTRNTFYKICDIFVLPSINRGEAFGIALLEAMCFSKPLITTKIRGSGVNFVNKHMKTGLVVEPKNSEQLADAILKLLKNDKLRKKLEKNAKKRFLKKFTKEKMINSTLKLYKKLTKF